MARAKTKTHKLGFGNGKIIEYEDGTAGYIFTTLGGQEFRVKISDVSGFSVTQDGSLTGRIFNVHGNGTHLGSAKVGHGVSEKIETWFRAHPDFGSGSRNVQPTGDTAAPMIADELRKLAELRQEGVLTESEFTAQKARLLGS